MLKRKLLIVIAIIAGVGFLTGCSSDYVPIKAKPKSSYKHKSTRSVKIQRFNIEHKTAFVATLSAFKNEGYSIESINIETGLINAIKHKRSSMLFSGRTHEYIKATAFVEKTHSGKLFIRLNFANYQESARRYGEKNGKSSPVRKSKFYKDMFRSIRKAISARVSE